MIHMRGFYKNVPATSATILLFLSKLIKTFRGQPILSFQLTASDLCPVFKRIDSTLFFNTSRPLHPILEMIPFGIYFHTLFTGTAQAVGCGRIPCEFHFLFLNLAFTARLHALPSRDFIKVSSTCLVLIEWTKIFPNCPTWIFIVSAPCGEAVSKLAPSGKDKCLTPAA